MHAGILAAVINLSCQSNDFPNIQCNWDPPFSLTSTPEYIVNVSNSTGFILLSNSTKASYINWTVNQYDLYNVSVTPNNTAGLGQIEFTTVDISSNYYITINKILS